MADQVPLIVNTSAGASPFKQMPVTDNIPAANMAGKVVISPAQITADQDNYAPTDWATADVVLLSFNTSFPAITGLTAWTNGRPKWLINTGANSGYLPSQHPDSSAANRIAGEGDWIMGGYDSLMVFCDTTNSVIRVLHTTFDVANLHLSGRGQLYMVPPGSTNQSDQPFWGLAQASGSNGNTPPASGLPAAWDIDTASSASGASTLYIAKNNNGFSFFGSAHIVVGFWGWLPAVSTSSQRFTSQISITNNPSGTALNNNNSFGFRVVDNVNGGKWQFFSRDNGGSEATADTGITPAANVLVRGLLMIDKARSEERVFITDGTTTYQARNTSNLPNAVLCGARAIAIASVGTTTKVFNVGHSGYEIRI